MTDHPQDHPSRVWFITGCASGLGRAFARAIIEKGERIAVTARRLETIADFQRDNPDIAAALTLDVTRPREVEKAVLDTVRRFGRIDVLVNNAGFGVLGAIEEVSDEDVRRLYDTNVFGLLNVIRAVLPHMRRRRSGHIINVSSIAGLASNPGSGIYGSTKFAVEGITEALAEEVRPLGIKVTALAPGPFRTAFTSPKLAAARPIDDYAATPVGFWRDRIPRMHGKQPGDPAKAAHVLFMLVNAETPPVHLVIGNSALDRIREKIDAFNRELDSWEAVGRSVDHEGETMDIR